VSHAKANDTTTGSTKMNASEIAFGIEFETTLPASDPTPIGPYHGGYQVAWLPTGWKAERDGSIRTTLGRKACEFVSPKLRGAEGVAEVERAIDAINARGAKVNETCGLHITIEWNGDAAALARLISLVGNHEKAIFASTGTRRREQTVYTKQIKLYGDKDRKAALRGRPLPLAEPHALGPRTEPDRVPGVQRDNEQDEGIGLPDDVPGAGRAGAEQQALPGLGLREARRHA
jgi:hypothetical protein